MYETLQMISFGLDVAMLIIIFMVLMNFDSLEFRITAMIIFGLSVLLHPVLFLVFLGFGLQKAVLSILFPIVFAISIFLFKQLLKTKQ